MRRLAKAVVGWSMSHRINRELVLQALLMALYQRRPDADLMHHSDRGSQYASDDFQALLDTHGIDCSMSGAGNCYDMLRWEASSHCSSANASTGVIIEPDTKPGPMCSTTSSASTIASVGTGRQEA